MLRQTETPMSTAILPPLFDRPPVAVRRFSVSEYHRLIAGAVLGESDRVELLEGWIVPKMIHNPAHALAIENGQVALQARLPAGWRLRVQLPITTADSEPEPDFAVVRELRRRRKQTHPLSADVAIVIEAADSTLADDRRIKGRLYARASIPIYWIVNLADQRVEVYSDPSGPAPVPAYKTRQIYGMRQSVPLVIEGQRVAVVPVREFFS